MTKEEATKRIKERMDKWALDDKDIEALSEAIPELVESEALRIRKAIESIIRVYGKTHGGWIDGYDMDTLVVHLRNAFASLEKQKEQKPVEPGCPQFVFDDILAIECAMGIVYRKGNEEELYEALRSLNSRLTDVIYTQKEQRPDIRDADDLQLLGFIYDLLNEIKWKDGWAMSKEECLRRLNDYRPQKSVVKQEWSINDEAFLKVAIAICNRYSHKDIADWLKSLPERFNLLPKQEWNEEDEKAVENCIYAINQTYKGENNPHRLGTTDWLKSLSERFNLPPKQEWNEEDKDKVAQYLHDMDGGMLWSKATEITSDILDILHPQPKAELTLLDENIIKAAVAFVKQNDHFNCWGGIDKHTVIKALRSLKPHWKPSEEQMDLKKFTAEMDDWKARFNHPDNIPIKATMAFVARMFYMYPNAARKWYENLPKTTQD